MSAEITSNIDIDVIDSKQDCCTSPELLSLDLCLLSEHDSNVPVQVYSKGLRVSTSCKDMVNDTAKCPVSSTSPFVVSPVSCSPVEADTSKVQVCSHAVMPPARAKVKYDVKINCSQGSVNSKIISLHLLKLHARVHSSGMPNYKSCRLAVPSRLNVDVWRSYLRDYSDYQICDFLEFGWPVGYDYANSGFPVSSPRNHQGALSFPDDIDSYINKESSLGAVIGPFVSNPFECLLVASSPLNSVPKQEPGERRIILDLSWPIGTSVNDGISSQTYLGESFSLTYPTVDLIASMVCASGPGALLYKRDLKRAYRQFPVDPFDYPLLGYHWKEQLYFDVVLPMGLRSAAMACQRITQGVCHISQSHGHNVTSYLDDFIGVGVFDAA